MGDEWLTAQCAGRSAPPPRALGPGVPPPRSRPGVHLGVWLPHLAVCGWRNCPARVKSALNGRPLVSPENERETGRSPLPRLLSRLSGLSRPVADENGRAGAARCQMRRLRLASVCGRGLHVQRALGLPVLGSQALRGKSSLLMVFFAGGAVGLHAPRALGHRDPSPFSPSHPETGFAAAPRRTQSGSDCVCSPLCWFLKFPCERGLQNLSFSSLPLVATPSGSIPNEAREMTSPLSYDFLYY